MKQSIAELVDTVAEGGEKWHHQAVVVGHWHICVGMRNAGTAETTAVPLSSHGAIHRGWQTMRPGLGVLGKREVGWESSLGVGRCDNLC